MGGARIALGGIHLHAVDHGVELGAGQIEALDRAASARLVGRLGRPA